MTVLAAPAYAEARRIVYEHEREMRDRTYVTTTKLGGHVDSYLAWLTTERGGRPETAKSFEYTLARLARMFAWQPLDQFEAPEGTRLIREFLQHYYRDAAANTWNKNVATCKSFFRWAYEEGLLLTNPAGVIRYREQRGSERRAHPPSLLERIVAAQPERRDRVAVQLMARMALRRNELRLVQFKHVDNVTGELTVFGKGGTVLPVAIPPDLHRQLLAHALERQADHDEHLLYPMKLGRVGSFPDYTMAVIWEDRRAPLTVDAVGQWWKRCLARAGVDHFPMHELRHSAGTTFYRETRDLKLTQLLMRHKKSSTTADTYLHLDQADLAEAWAALPGWEIET